MYRNSQQTDTVKYCRSIGQFAAPGRAVSASLVSGGNGLPSRGNITKTISVGQFPPPDLREVYGCGGLILETLETDLEDIIFGQEDQEPHHHDRLALNYPPKNYPQ